MNVEAPSCAAKVELDRAAEVVRIGPAGEVELDVVVEAGDQADPLLGLGAQKIVRSHRPSLSSLRAASAAISTGPLQRLVQVGEQVLEVLDPDGEPEQPVPEADPVPLVGGHRGVGHQPGVLGERFHRSEQLREREQA